MEIKEGSQFMDNVASSKVQTALIVGSNSMIGRHLVTLFIEKGWTVFTTVSNKRKIPKEKTSNVHFIEVNLEKPKSIKKGIKRLFKNTEQVDVLINTAGIVLMGATEAFTEKQIRREMEVNFFGVINTIQEVLPFMRKRGSGVILNISSLCGMVTFPMLSFYHASKWALEGFSESLYYELGLLGIKVKLVEPGGITEEGKTSAVESPENKIAEYDEMAEKVNFTKCFPSFSTPQEIAEVIYLAATDNSNRLRYVVGEESFKLIGERNNISIDEAYLQKMKNRVFNNKQ
jgi:NAD(P)-dependent dehydrogenase (short-subunit alcohol dehydrogenase family)